MPAKCMEHRDVRRRNGWWLRRRLLKLVQAVAEALRLHGSDWRDLEPGRKDFAILRALGRGVEVAGQAPALVGPKERGL